MIPRIGFAPAWWEFGVEPVLAMKTLFASSAPDSLPPPHSYTHRTRSASPVPHDRSRVILYPKKNDFFAHHRQLVHICMPLAEDNPGRTPGVGPDSLAVQPGVTGGIARAVNNVMRG